MKTTEKVVLVPYQDDEHLEQYWTNFVNKNLRDHEVDESFTAECWWCCKPGVLGTELIYVGTAHRFYNLMCDICRQCPITRQTWEYLNWTSPNYDRDMRSERERFEQEANGKSKKRLSR
jgi:hypothetical protein